MTKKKKGLSWSSVGTRSNCGFRKRDVIRVGYGLFKKAASNELKDLNLSIYGMLPSSAFDLDRRLLVLGGLLHNN